MSEENNSQEFKSVSPTTTEANYKHLMVRTGKKNQMEQVLEK